MCVCVRVCVSVCVRVRTERSFFLVRCNTYLSLILDQILCILCRAKRLRARVDDKLLKPSSTRAARQAHRFCAAAESASLAWPTRRRVRCVVQHDCIVLRRRSTSLSLYGSKAPQCRALGVPVDSRSTLKALAGPTSEWFARVDARRPRAVASVLMCGMRACPFCCC